MAKQLKSGPGDGEMSLPECANYLHLSETTVLKLATEGKLPGLLLDRKWQFQRELIDEWLAEQLNVGDDDAIEDIPDGMRVPLGDLLPEEAIIGDLESRDALGTIEELAALAYREKWLNDKPWFVGAVVEREMLASTAMEGGVAFLHTRAREASRIARPFIITGRSYSGVDFGAPDGKPTFLFFLLGLKYDRLHLPILGRLARTVRNPATIAKLRSQPSTTKMRALLLEEDAKSLSSARPAPVRYEAMKPKLDRQIRLRTIKRLDAIRKRQAEQIAKKQKAAEKAKRIRKKTTRAAPDDDKKTTSKAASDRVADGAKKTSKKTAAEKSASKVAGGKKAAGQKSTSAKSTATASSTGLKKSAEKKATGDKKPAARKVAAKTTVAKKATAKKVTGKTSAARKKAAAKRSAHN